MLAETVTITGAGGDEIEAYQARALRDQPLGGVVVIHHMPGYDEESKEATRRFAHMGYNAICPNLYSREAPGASPDDAAATVRAAGGVPDERLVGEVEEAAAHLRRLGGGNRRVGVIGYCSGGRQAFLAACSLDLDAAVDCYGAFVVATPPAGLPNSMRPIAHLAPDLRCPLLGLFGADDSHPDPAEVATFDRMLTDAGKEHDFHIFEGAGHGFFSVETPKYRAEAAAEGWRLIAEFFQQHLAEG